MRVLRFFAEWCGPCRMSRPSFLDFVEDSGVSWAEIDVETEPEYAELYDVRMVPTYVFIDDNETVRRVVSGPVPRVTLDHTLSEIG